eukprot:4702864-Amphidinium_carterae.1
MGIDMVAQIARRIREALKNRHFYFKLSDGTAVQGLYMNIGTLCPKVGSLDFLDDCSTSKCLPAARRLEGRMEVRRRARQRQRSSTCCSYLQTNLPFGASASVLAFNRVARAL